MFAKAPTLAWLLTALACFLAGMAVDEGRRQASALPARSATGVEVTYEIVSLPTATLVPPSAPTVAPSPTSCDPAAAGAPRFGCTGNA